MDSNSQRIKDFKAACPLTKMLVTEVYHNATSNTAKRFLDKIQAEFPFPIRLFKSMVVQSLWLNLNKLVKIRILNYLYYRPSLQNTMEMNFIHSIERSLR